MAAARPPEPYPDQAWAAWGDPDAATELSPAVRQLLADGLGVHGTGAVAPPPESIELPPARLSGEELAALEGVVGEGAVLADHEARLRHTRGRSTVDLLRLRAGDAAAAPDAVLLPESHAEVQALLELCTGRRIAVVPFGGGTSVVGGLEPEASEFAGVVALDLRRMDALQGLDEESRVAELEPGLRGPQAEALVNARGYTIGHFPQSFEYASLGGFAAARSSGQASAGYGRFDEIVVGLRIATPAGTIELGRAPRSAAGPDLRQLFLGSEGALGVITSLKVAVRPRPEARRYEAWRFASFGAGTAALRGLVQDGPRPAVLRLSDEAESAINLSRPSALGADSPEGGCLAIVGYEGTPDAVDEVAGRTAERLQAAGATRDAEAGQRWAEDRFRGPYLRDALIDAGALVETLETATFWSGLSGLYHEVSAALREALEQQGTPPVILCHISHVYPTGASLYFTVGCAQLPDPIAQWSAAKAAASEAIMQAGGSITHHHGVGTDHRRWYEHEMGPLAISALRAVKRTLDPAGIMNPGILLPRETG